jgi:hypothetical protein
MGRPLRPPELFATLAEHRVRYVVIGGLAAVLHGSAVATVDADICPDPEPENLRRLCAALDDMHARIRTPDDDDGIDFRCEPGLLVQMKMLNLFTDFGAFDLSFSPAAFDGYQDLVTHAVEISVAGVSVWVAALDDVILSKETANRPKDKAGLPHLYALRDEIAEREQRNERRGGRR